MNHEVTDDQNSDNPRGCKQFWTRRKLICLAAVSLVPASLVWPGWPLHPVAAVAAGRARDQGLVLQTKSPWLRIHSDMTARVTVGSLRLADAANPDALSAGRVDLRWQLGGLFSGNLAPASVHIDEVAARLVAGEDGLPRFLTMPAGNETTPASATPFTPADLSGSILPRIDHPLALSVGRVRVDLPPGLPAKQASAGPVALELGRPDADTLRTSVNVPLLIDDRPGALDLALNLRLSRDWLGDLALDVQAAPAAGQPPLRVALKAARDSADAPATLSLHINDCAPGAWLPLLGRDDLPTVAGVVDLEFTARGDPLKNRLDHAAAQVATTGLTVVSPLIARPLVVPDTRFALNVEDNGARGAIAAFATRAGPFAIRSPGIRWDTAGDTVSGEGEMLVDAVPLAELLSWLPAETRAQLPLADDEAAKIGIDATRLGLRIDGDRRDGRPRIAFDTRGGLVLNGNQLVVEAGGVIDTATGAMQADIAVPDFVQARWQLAVLRRFPAPELAAPLRAEVKLRGRWPDTLEEARWSVVAGEGHVVPKGPSLRWLAKPFPISSFTLAGRIDDGLKKLTIEQLAFASGRARFALDRTELNSRQALTAATAADTQARFTLTLENWFPADFLPLLGPELEQVVAPVATDLARIGLERLETGAEVNFPSQPWLDPTIRTLNGRQSALVRVGDERIPVQATWTLDPDTGRVAASFQLPNLRPDRLALSAFDQSPVPPSALDLAFAVKIGVSADPRAQSLDAMDLRASVDVTAENGAIKANPLLAADLPVARMEMSARARILPLRLTDLRVFADFAGPTLLIDDGRADFGASGLGAMRVALRELPLDWARARVPTEWIPIELRDARVGGQLIRLDLRAEFPTPSGDDAVPDPTALDLAAELHDLRLALPDSPELSVPTVEARGGLDQLTVLVPRVTTDGVELTKLQAVVAKPLAVAPRAEVSGNARVDLARMPALLATPRLRELLPDGLALDGLAGIVDAGFTATAPLEPAKLPAELRATLAVNARDLAPPAALLPPDIRVGPTALALSADIAGESAGGKLSMRPSALVVAPWLNGPPVVETTFAVTRQKADLRTSIDLSKVVIETPEVCWRKAVGQPAALNIEAAVTLPASDTAAQVEALIQGEGLAFSPLRTRLSAALADERNPGLNLAPQVAFFRLRETSVGRSSLELDVDRAADGATRVALRSPKLDLAEWVERLSPAIVAWNRASVAPATPVATPAATSTTAPAAITPLDLPAIDLRADIERIVMSDTRDISGVAVDAALRDGLPARLTFAANAGGAARIDLRLDPAAGRHPWSFAMTDMGGWLRTGAAPLERVPSAPDLPDSTLESLRALPASFVGGDIALRGTADFRDAVNTLDGGGRVDGLVLEQELTFLARIAALVKKRVILQVPFKVFDLPAFTVSPSRVSLQNMRVEGPLTVTSDRLNLDFARNEIDMGGKVLGIGFEVAGPIDDPRFYLTEKNLLIKGITQQNDFDW